MIKFEKAFQHFVFVFLVFCMGFIAYIGFQTLFPFNSKKVDIFIPVDKHVYHPGDRVGVFVKTCKDRTEFKNVSFQLEDVGKNVFVYLGQNREIAFAGCFEIYDFSPVIPLNLFENDIIKEGEFKIWIRVDQARNPFREPEVYQSETFTIKM